MLPAGREPYSLHDLAHVSSGLDLYHTTAGEGLNDLDGDVSDLSDSRYTVGMIQYCSTFWPERFARPMLCIIRCVQELNDGTRQK